MPVMIKICPNCKRPQEDVRLLACPTCKVPFVVEIAQQRQPDPSPEVIAKSLSAAQLERIADYIARSWKFRLVFVAVFLIGVLLSVPTVIVISLHYANKAIQESLDSVNKETTRRFSFATNETTRQFQAFVETATNQMSSAYCTITNQIMVEFQEPRIRKTVEDVAGTQAKVILQEELRPTVESFRADAEFLRLATRAHAYDFKAYLRLLALQTQTNNLKRDAEAVVAEIDRSLQRERSQLIPARKYVMYSGTNFYGGRFTSDELAVRFSEVQQDKTSFNREGFVNTVAELEQPLFLSWLIQFLTNETDLAVADRLTIAISGVAHADFHAHDFERIQTWWRLHENEYTNWPLSEFGRGLDEWNKCNYRNAAKLFQSVLDLDPSADMSRSLAIGSWSELGETNKVAALVKGFVLPTGRWAELAAVKVELETGNVSNATVRFVDLARKNPVMPGVPGESYHVWRKIDWQLFHKLISMEKP